MDPVVSYAKNGDLSIAYSVMGDGPIDLVVAPGIVSHVEASFESPHFAGAMRQLASFARVINFDKRGTGLSDPVEMAPTLEERMEDLTAVLDAAGAERPALLGISEGGPTCTLFAATHPDRVRALVLFGAYARGLAADDYPWAPAPDQMSQIERQIDDEWGHGALLDLYAPSHAADPDFRQWWARFQQQAATPAMARALVQLASEVDIREVLPAVPVPTLVLHRTGDRVWPVGGAQFIADQIPGARLVEFSGNDHLAFAGDDEFALGQIEGFLTGSQLRAEPDRQLLTVLFTDIVSSTERAAELGDRRWRGVLDGHDDLVREQLNRFGGREVKTTGDGFLATFDGPARGIECAEAIKGGIGVHGIEVRAGLHTGECEVRGDDVAGMAVHIGARVAGLAGASEVLVSSTVKDLVVGSPIEFEPRGAHSLKGVPGEWSIFAVTGSAENP